MSTLTEHRPVASLPFGGNTVWLTSPFPVLQMQVFVVSLVFSNKIISAQFFDHIRSGREWGLSTLLSHYYLGIYNTRVESSTVGKEYYQQLLTYLRRSGSNQTVSINCDVLVNIDLNQVFHLHNTTKVRSQLYIRNFQRKTFQMWILFWKSMKLTMFVRTNSLIINLRMNSSTCLQISLLWTLLGWLNDLKKRLRKNILKRLRYVLRDLAAKEGALLTNTQVT